MTEREAFQDRGLDRRTQGSHSEGEPQDISFAYGGANGNVVVNQPHLV